MSTPTKKKNVPPPMTTQQHLKAARGTLGRAADDLVNDPTRDRGRDVLLELYLLAGQLHSLIEVLDDDSDEISAVLDAAEDLELAVKDWKGEA